MSIRHEACQTCGTLLEYAHENAVVTCPACGTCNKLPDERVRDRADFRNARALQQRGDFLDAEASYQRVLDDIPDDADALWGRLLCHYGAALITDAGPQRRYTIRIPRSKPLRAQGDYERVLESAPAEMVGQYESDAAYIDLAMLRIKRLAETKAPYDIFICHKTTPLEGKGYTEDYARARDLRDLLVHKGYRVFFAPIDMEGVSAGEDYEAGIYHALNTARVMLVICSDPQHLQSTWVRSEWERYLTRVDDGKGAALIPLLYGGMKAGAMPRAYQIRNLQAIRMELDGKDRLLERLGQLFPRRMPVAAPVVAAPVVVPVAPAKAAPAAAPVAVPAKPSDKPRKPVWPWVLLLCVVLALGGGVVLALQSGETDDDYEYRPVPSTAAPVVKTATPELDEVVEPEDGEVSPYTFALEVTPTPEPWTATPEPWTATPAPRTATPVPKPNGNNELSSYGYVTERDVMFRTSASSYSTAIRSLQQYDMAAVLGTETVNGVTWYHVFYDGREGYIQGKYFHQMTMGELEQFGGLTKDTEEVVVDGYMNTTATRTSIPVPSSDISVGSYITFGHYEQDNKLANGAEPIEWLVLAVENERALVISRYALDCQQYYETWTDITWENCTLRTWLNGTFLNKAFDKNEQYAILTTRVTADMNPSSSMNPGNATQDKVFLLSAVEAERYFTSDMARKCKLTAYAATKSSYSWWWLRSPGYYQNCATMIFVDGSVYLHGHKVSLDNGAVRPAMWVDLNSGFF